MVWLLLMIVGVWGAYRYIDKISDNLNPYNFDRK